MRSDYQERLSAHLQALKIAVPHKALAQMAQHAELLHTWNQTHNLTALTDPQAVVVQHYLDCILGLLKLLPPLALVDVGSGAGFPGLIAAILWPNTQVTLIESKQKKCSFLNWVVSALNLTNVQVGCGRIEAMGSYPYILSRAAFSVKDLPSLLAHLAPEGELVLFVGQKTSFDAVKNLCEKHGLKSALPLSYVLPDTGERFIYQGKNVSRET